MKEILIFLSGFLLAIGIVMLYPKTQPKPIEYILPASPAVKIVDNKLSF